LALATERVLVSTSLEALSAFPTDLIAIEHAVVPRLAVRLALILALFVDHRLAVATARDQQSYTPSATAATMCVPS
jgi:hypothetical protein